MEYEVVITFKVKPELYPGWIGVVEPQQIKAHVIDMINGCDDWPDDGLTIQVHESRESAERRIRDAMK